MMNIGANQSMSYLINFENVDMSMQTANNIEWGTMELPNILTSGGVFEFSFQDETPRNDYGNIIDIGGDSSALESWGTNKAIHFYHGYDETSNNIVVRFNSVTTNVPYIVGQSNVVKVDSDYVYVNGSPVVALRSEFKNLSMYRIGSFQGTKRFFGYFDYIRYGGI